MLQVRVAGGTNAGRRPPLGEPRPWVCRKSHHNPRYAVTCLHAGCREKRP